MTIPQDHRPGHRINLLTQHWLCVPDNLQVNQHPFGVVDHTPVGQATHFNSDALVTARQPNGVQVHDHRQLWQPPRLWHDISEIMAR